MNTLELNRDGLMELDSIELQAVDGGFWEEVAIGLVLLAAASWGDIREGWADGVAGGPARH